MGKKKVLIISFTSLRSSRRVFRQLMYFKDKYEVHAMGFEDAGIPGVHFHKVTPLFQQMSTLQMLVPGIMFLLSLFEKAYPHIYEYQQALVELKLLKFDLFIVHDIKPLPLAMRIDNKVPVLCDAHEYYPDIGGFSLASYFFFQRFDNYLLRNYFLSLKHIITVNEWIAEQFRKMTSADVQVITSAAEFYDLTPGTCNGEKIMIVYHGMADEQRKIELTIQTAQYLDERFQMDLMLTTTTFDAPYYQMLKQLCEGKKNVRLIPAVDSSDIIPFTNRYDIGLFILPNTYLSHAYSLPNKFFEFVQARLMIVVGPNPEMGAWVKKYGLGIVTEDFDPANVAAQLNKLTVEEINNYKTQSHNHAQVLSAGHEMKKLEKIMEGMIN